MLRMSFVLLFGAKDVMYDSKLALATSRRPNPAKRMFGGNGGVQFVRMRTGAALVH